MKNDLLEFSIPYEYEREKPYYKFDYIVKWKNGATLILEVKGDEDNKTKPKPQRAKEWISTMNNWSKLGKWDFLVSGNPAKLRSAVITLINKRSTSI